MKQNIKQLTHTLQAEFIAFYVVAAIFALVFELNPTAQGTAVGNDLTEYMLETISVLLTMIVIPVSLKLFSVMSLRHRSLTMAIRIRNYRMWSTTRLLAIGMVMIYNLWVYYATLNNIGGFCALICMVAALFCCPTRKRICCELENNESK